MPTDAKLADAEPANGGIQRRNPPIWALGSRLAALNVEIGRKAYRRYAETAELALNTFESTASRAVGDFHAVASGTRETMLDLADRGYTAARELRGRAREMNEGGLVALEANAARGRADVRRIALTGQIAIDTNVKSCLDCAEALSRASDLREVVALQGAFVSAQWRRSLRQMRDLQHLTVDMWRKAASPRAA